MKKIIFGMAVFLMFSCSSEFEELPAQLQLPRIQTLTIQDDEITNGNPVLYEKLDFKFEYAQDKLIKVWDIHNNYTENLTYNNNSLSGITISGFVYPDLASQNTLNVNRVITCDASNRIILSQNPAVFNNGNTFYTTFEYPSQGIIIAKDYNKYLNYPEVLNKTSKIYVQNENVVKVQLAYNGSTVFVNEVRYEYDQKVNPNYLVDKNRILALPEYAYNVFMLQDYSQISKNNVLVKKKYLIHPAEHLLETTNFSYTYQTNDLPGSIVLQYDYPNNSGLKVSAIFGY